MEAGKPERALARLVRVLERRNVDDDDSFRVMDLAREAAAQCRSPRLKMTALLLAGDLEGVERYAYSNREAAVLSALAGVGDRRRLADALLEAGDVGHAALVLDDLGANREAAQAWTAFSERAAQLDERYLREVGRLRAALAMDREHRSDETTADVDAAARALEILGDDFARRGREDRAYDCYATAVTALDRSYVRLPVIQEKLRKLANCCLLPAFVCQIDAELIDVALSSHQHARAELIARRALEYAESWQPGWVDYFKAISRGREADELKPNTSDTLPIFVDRAIRNDVMELETIADPAVMLGRVVLDRHYSNSDRRLAGGLRLHLHLSAEESWGEDEVVRFVEALGRMSASVAEAIIGTYLAHPSAKVRAAVARAASPHSRRSLGWLAKLGADAERSVREAAAEALASHRAASSLPGLVDLWASAHTEAVRNGVARALVALRRHGAPLYGVPSGDEFDRLVESREAGDREATMRLLAQVRQMTAE
jgi:tetratricopeptide (TPR) repeat protein